MRKEYIIESLISVDIQETVRTGDEIIQIYEGVIYQENLKISPLRKVIEKLFTLRQKYKDEKKDLLQRLLKLILKRLYGVQLRGDIIESYYCKSETWMKTEFDEKVLEYWKLRNENYIVKIKKDDGLDDDCDIENTLPAHLWAFILSNSERTLNNFVREISGFFIKNIYYGDTDSLYIEKKFWDVLDKAKLIGEKFCQG